mmetsp:Transcript_13766/g.41085  ORF Transcript_13766/g.41085 Transcript_13766/m.41085 type:complete len:221 (+) Transcript_13766:162-824(+)
MRMRRAFLLVACTTMCAARRAVPRWVAPRGGAADDEPAAYRPRTKEARAAYEAVLAGVRRTLGDVPRDVLAGAADEALHVLKDEAAADGDRRAKLERLLGARLGDEQFSELAALGRKVTDFTPDQTPTGQAGADDGGLDEEMGVAVVFDEDESDDEERDVDEVESEEDDDDAARGVERDARVRVVRGAALELRRERLRADRAARRLGRHHRDAAEVRDRL